MLTIIYEVQLLVTEYVKNNVIGTRKTPDSVNKSEHSFQNIFIITILSICDSIQ